MSLTLTHYWDCNGFGCDSTTLQPWNESAYFASAAYSPQDPADHGGPSAHGESLWLFGAASDDLAAALGDADPCCGSDNDSPGCGRCVLLTVPTAASPATKAIAMKKNRCPPWSAGCEAGSLHLDLAVPGFDNAEYSTANVCGMASRAGGAGGWDFQPEGRDVSHASYSLGDWYERHADTTAASGECAALPPQFVRGCERFAAWGWTVGNPTASYEIVDCPPALVELAAGAFDANGPTPLAPLPPAPPPAPAAASAAGVSTSVAVGIGVAVFAGLVGVLAATLLCVNAQKRRRQGAVPPEVQVGGV